MKKKQINKTKFDGNKFCRVLKPFYEGMPFAEQYEAYNVLSRNVHKCPQLLGYSLVKDQGLELICLWHDTESIKDWMVQTFKAEADRLRKQQVFYPFC